MRTCRAGMAAGALVVAGLALAGAAFAAPGDYVSTVTFSEDCQSGLGVGVAYDGTYLWYSCFQGPTDLHRADPTTGIVNASYSLAGGLGALSYDATRNVIWAGDGGGGSGKVYKITLDGAQNVTGISEEFNVTPDVGPCGLDDGLAFDARNVGDATDDVLYYSNDCFTQTIRVFDLTGLLGESFPWAGGDCYNSGLAVGGSLLYQGSDGCSKVWVVDKVSKLFSYSFLTNVVPGDPNFRDEDLECDTKTFAALGKHVMWSKEAYSPMRAHAFEIEFNSCGIGGTPTGECPLTQGFWKNHEEEWPQCALTLGTVVYTQAQWLALFRTPPNGDASLILAHQLMAAKLNVCNGADPTPIAPVIAAADALIDGSPIPMGVGPSSPLGQQMTGLAEQLDDYNNGAFAGPRCQEQKGLEEPLAAAGPDGVRLEQNMPNPFRSPTSIAYSLPTAMRVRLTVHDVAGRQIKTLVDGTQDAGSHRAMWDGANQGGAPVGSGIYIYRLQAGTSSRVRSMVMVR